MTAAERHKKHYYKAQEKFSFECEFCEKEDFTSSDSLVRYNSVKVISRGYFLRRIFLFQRKHIKQDICGKRGDVKPNKTMWKGKKRPEYWGSNITSEEED